MQRQIFEERKGTNKIEIFWERDEGVGNMEVLEGGG